MGTLTGERLGYGPKNDLLPTILASLLEPWTLMGLGHPCLSWPSQVGQIGKVMGRN